MRAAHQTHNKQDVFRAPRLRSLERGLRLGLDGALSAVSRGMIHSGFVEEVDPAYEKKQSMNLCLGRVAVVDEATHETKHVESCNSSMGERNCIRKLMEAG